MIQIAVCDGTITGATTTQYALNEYFTQYSNVPAQIYCFKEGKDIVNQLNKGEHFDLLILEASFTDMNGIELAQTIRWFNQDVHIIFLTAVKNYALSTYSVQVLGYMLKPLRRADFFPLLSKVVWQYTQRIGEESDPDKFLIFPTPRAT